MADATTRSVPFPGTLLQVQGGSVYTFPLKGCGHYWEGPRLKGGDVLLYVRPAVEEDLPMEELVYNVSNLGVRYHVGLFGERLIVFKLPDGHFRHISTK